MAGAVLTHYIFPSIYTLNHTDCFFFYFSLLVAYYLSDHFLSVNVYADVDQAPYGKQCYVVLLTACLGSNTNFLIYLCMSCLTTLPFPSLIKWR